MCLYVFVHWGLSQAQGFTVVGDESYNVYGSRQPSGILGVCVGVSGCVCLRVSVWEDVIFL